MKWLLLFAVIFLLGTTIAYAGVEPFSGVKDKAVSWLEEEKSGIELLGFNEDKPNEGELTLPEKIKPKGIVGKWQCITKPNEYVEFFDTGRVVIDAGELIISGTYELIGDEYIKLYLEGWSGGWLSMASGDTWKYVIANDVLYINAAGKEIIFRRVH